MRVNVIEREAPVISSIAGVYDYEDFFENGAVGLHLVDRNGVILRANKAELDMLGYTAAEYVGRPISEFHADAVVIEDILRRLAAGERLDKHSARLKAKDGSIRHVLLSSSALFRDGEFIHTRCFSVDVTGLRNAEAACLDAEQRLASTYDNATVGIAETDAETHVLRVNAAFAALTGYGRDELIGKRFDAFTHPDDRERDLALYQDQVAGRTDKYSLEKRYVRKDGKVAFVEVLSSSVRRPDGSFQYGVRIAKDVSDRKHAERRLQENEQRSRELLNALPMAVYTTDAEGRITYYNEAAVALAGRRPTLGVDRWCVTWKLYWPDGSPLPHDQCPMAHALNSGEELRGVEAVAERPDGTRRVFTPFPTLLRNGAGQVIGAVNVLVDVTELKRAGDEQRVLINELNHRVKNTLATVQSISLQTHRSTPDTFVECFEDRLIALSKTHDLLTRRRWTGVEFGELLRQGLAPYSEPGNSRVSLHGPELMLSPRTGLTFSMVMHELLTKAAKYGALRTDKGSVGISWTIEETQAGARLMRLRWVESGGPTVGPPLRRGFGRRLIERSITKDLGGQAELNFDPKGLQCFISFPLK